MALFKIAIALEPGTNRLIASIIGGGLLGAGSSLALKDQKEHALRNSLVGALLGGLGYTGYAGWRGNKLKKDFLEQIEKEYLPKVKEQVWKGEKIDKPHFGTFENRIKNTLPFEKWRESVIKNTKKEVRTKTQQTKERTEDLYQRAVSSYIDKWLKDSYGKAVESVAYRKALYDLDIPHDLTKATFKNRVDISKLKLEIPLPKQDEKVIKEKLLRYMDLHGYKPQGDPLYEISEFLEHIAEPEAQKKYLALKDKIKKMKK